MWPHHLKKWANVYRKTSIRAGKHHLFAPPRSFSRSFFRRLDKGVKNAKCLTIPQASSFCSNFSVAPFVQLIPSCLSVAAPHSLACFRPQLPQQISSSLYMLASTLVPKIRQMSPWTQPEDPCPQNTLTLFKPPASTRTKMRRN